jgi:hypothetical protein
MGIGFITANYQSYLSASQRRREFSDSQYYDERQREAFMAALAALGATGGRT